MYQPARLTTPPALAPEKGPGLRAIARALSFTDGGNIIDLADTLKLNVDRAYADCGDDPALSDAVSSVEAIIPELRAIEIYIQDAFNTIVDFVEEY